MPAGMGTRPTSERVREALFGRLEHLAGLTGATVLDLFAGSGALGFEAASRGATSVISVESDRRASELIKRNARTLGLGAVRVMPFTAQRALATGGAGQVDLLLADPPYELSEDDLAEVLRLALPWLAEDALLVVERSARSPEPVWPADVELIGPRRYGDTVMWFAEYVPEGDVA